jgi:excisionase family DNA binding protein
VTPITLDGVLTTSAAAARHGTSATTIIKAIGRGELPAERVGNQWLVRATDADRWAASRVDRRRRQRP